MTFDAFLAAIGAAFDLSGMLTALAVIFVASAGVALAIAGGNIMLNQIKRLRKT